jgi:hypothetical protein
MVVVTEGQMSEFVSPPRQSPPRWKPRGPAGRSWAAGVALSSVAVVVAAGALAGLVVLAGSQDKPPAWGAAAAATEAADTPPPSEAAETYPPPPAEESTQPPAPTVESTQPPAPTVESTWPPKPRKAHFGDVVEITQRDAEAAALRVERPVFAASFDHGQLLPSHGAFVSFRVTFAAKLIFDYDVAALYVQLPDGTPSYVTSGMREPEVDQGQLDPGQRITGWVTFDAPRHGTLAYYDDTAGFVQAKWSY